MTVQPTRDQLRALADRASRGPWAAHDGYVSAAEGRDGIAGNCMDVDAEFIAAARTAVPALLDALDQAEARIQAARELHHHDVFRGHLDNGCAICGHEWPCPTIRALDGEG